MNKKYDKNRGFSLVELSIVLVVIGLLVGGITAGVSIVRGSKLKSVITDVENFKTGLLNFRSQYDAIPGDMLNAHDYWDDGADGVCGTASDCNGNGNRRIDWSSGSSGNERETYRSWQHLSLAGLVAGNFTGIGYAGSGNRADIGINIPASKVAGGGFNLYYHTWFSISGNAIQFGAARGNTAATNSIINPKDAANIDKKIDDGSLESGKVLTHRGVDMSGSGCFQGSAGSRTYILNDPAITCRMLFFVE